MKVFSPPFQASSTNLPQRHQMPLPLQRSNGKLDHVIQPARWVAAVVLLRPTVFSVVTQPPLDTVRSPKLREFFVLK